MVAETTTSITTAHEPPAIGFPNTVGAIDLATFDFWIGVVLLAALACLLVYGVFDTRFALARAQGAAALALLRRNTRRLWILIAGTTVIVIGILISPLPGPGFSVLAPIGLAILASEFAWAGRLTLEIKRRSVPIQDATWRVARRTPKWTVAPVCLLYWSVPVALSIWSSLPTFAIWPASSILFTPVFLWAILVFKGHPRAASSGSAPGDSGPAKSE